MWLLTGGLIASPSVAEPPFTLSGFERVSAPSGHSLVLKGKTHGLPVGVWLQVTLHADGDEGRVLDRRAVRCDGQGFEARFGEYRALFFPRDYWVSASFFPANQPGKIRGLLDGDRTGYEMGVGLSLGTSKSRVNALRRDREVLIQLEKRTEGLYREARERNDRLGALESPTAEQRGAFRKWLGSFVTRCQELSQAEKQRLTRWTFPPFYRTDRLLSRLMNYLRDAEYEARDFLAKVPEWRGPPPRRSYKEVRKGWVRTLNLEWVLSSDRAGDVLTQEVIPALQVWLTAQGQRIAPRSLIGKEPSARLLSYQNFEDVLVVISELDRFPWKNRKSWVRASAHWFHDLREVVQEKVGGSSPLMSDLCGLAMEGIVWWKEAYSKRTQSGERSESPELDSRVRFRKLVTKIFLKHAFSGIRQDAIAVGRMEMKQRLAELEAQMTRVQQARSLEAADWTSWALVWEARVLRTQGRGVLRSLPVVPPLLDSESIRSGEAVIRWQGARLLELEMRFAGLWESGRPTDQALEDIGKSVRSLRSDK